MKWTPEEIDYLIANYSVNTIGEISEILSRSYGSVKSKIWHLGLSLDGDALKKRYALGINKVRNLYDGMVGENNPNWKGGISKDNYRYKKRFMVKYPERHKARYTLYNAIKSGKITRGCCIVCGKESAHAHHPDYEKPYEVIWLCQKHHNELHTRLKR